MGFINWLLGTSDGKLTDATDVLLSNFKQLNASKFAMQKCIGIIGNAIAKSEIIVQGQKGLRYDENYYRMNISPNENEHGTEFWSRVAEKLLLKQECLIVTVKDMYFIADSWTESNDVIRPREYSNVQITAAGRSETLHKRFKAGDVMHIRLPMARKRQEYMQSLANLYDKTVTAAHNVYKLAYTPKWGVKLDTNVRLVERTEDGSQ